jgi:hypothetical protein
VLGHPVDDRFGKELVEVLPAEIEEALLVLGERQAIGPSPGEAGGHHLEVDFFPRGVGSPQVSEGERLVLWLSREALEEIVEPGGQRVVVTHPGRKAVVVGRDLGPNVAEESESRADGAPHESENKPGEPAEKSADAMEATER